MSIIKSLNENITDSDTKAFLDQISQIGHQYENDQVVTYFVKMMSSLGKYLGNKKNNAHVDSLPVLNSISEQLETIITNPDLDKEKIKQIYSIEIEKYKTLKRKISSSSSIKDKDMNELKEVILAIDWEISDTTTGNFETVVAKLLSKNKTYKIHYIYLKIIHSIGKYIGRQQADAHTVSISFLKSIFKNLEKIVQTPTMPLKERKHLTENDISRFKEFKQKISQNKQPIKISTDPLEDENLPAALSHIKQNNHSSVDEELSLTTISESYDAVKSEYETNSDQISPALSGKGQSQAEPVDIMDNLFSLKDSPADELLDAIHLMDLNDPEQAQKVLDQTSEISSNGLKNLSIQNVKNKPIPEIESRLDEFFDLESPPKPIAKEDKALDNSIANKENIEIELSEDDEQADRIIPFEYEDESFDQILSEDNFIENNPPELNLTEPQPDNQTSGSIKILHKLNTSILASKGIFDEPSLLSINEYISFLERNFEDDPEKIQLLQILYFIVNLQKKEIDPLPPKSDNKISGDKKTGFWEKLKGIFKK